MENLEELAGPPLRPTGRWEGLRRPIQADDLSDYDGVVVVDTGENYDTDAVSYTHLTLPTICSV